MKTFEVLADEPKYDADSRKIHFEISNGDAKQACNIMVNQESESLALAFFHKNWPIIGKMAQDALAAGDLEDGEVRLVAPR